MFFFQLDDTELIISNVCSEINKLHQGQKRKEKNIVYVFTLPVAVIKTS